MVPRASEQLRRARRRGRRRGARPLGCGVLAVQQRQQVNTTATVGGGCGLNGDKLKQGKEGSGRGAHSELGGAVEEAGGGLELLESTMADGDVCDGDDDDGGRTGPPRSNPIA